MNRRIRLHLRQTQRFSKYLKPGALARLRDSRISARSHIMTHRVNSVTHSVPSPIAQESNSGAQIEFLPEFPSLDCGPRCFGRKKLVAVKSKPNDPFISVVSSNLLVH